MFSFIFRGIHFVFYNILYLIFRTVLPLQNKVIASCFEGKKYGDNPQYIFECLKEKDKNIEFVWMKNKQSRYDVPRWIRITYYERCVKTIYHLATAKILIDTHRFPVWVRKRKCQMFVETWHGGLGIKKIVRDRISFVSSKSSERDIIHTNKLADVFISQSDHLTKIFRTAFGYSGPVFKCGYPKNDIIVKGSNVIKEKVKSQYNVLPEDNVLLYVPSFRDYFRNHIDMTCYNVDFNGLQEALKKKFEGNWYVFVRWHPTFADKLMSYNDNFENPTIINVTSYPEIQELLLTADIVLSDYSSCLFDAAIRNIPCFIYANDFEEYKNDRGVYYELEDLPFPYAATNEELKNNILCYNHSAYMKRWKEFKEQTGLYEPGNASETIANKILMYLKGESFSWME